MTTAIEIGKTYKVASQRKGKFTMQVNGLSGEFVTGVIVDGMASAMMDYNEREKGEEITVRASLCTFTLVHLSNENGQAPPAEPSIKLEHATFLAARLRRVARLVGYPVPDMSDEVIAGCAPSILGSIASILERKPAPPAEQWTAAELERIKAQGSEPMSLRNERLVPGATDEPPPACQSEIYQNGKVAAVMDCRMHLMEALVKEACSIEPGMDWHYFGGRAVVKTLGDPVKARAALERVMPRFLDAPPAPEGSA